MGNLFKVATVGEIEPGRRKVVSINGKQIAIINIDGDLIAITNKCPHEAFPLTYAPVYENRIICPQHGWTFDVKTGKCLKDSSYYLRTYKVVIKDEDVNIEL